MASNVKAKVYTGASAALSVLDANGVAKRVAYVSDFTIDLSANSEDFNVIGQKFNEVIPTFNSWSASSSAKASFENEGQRLLLDAYENLRQIKAEFIVNNSTVQEDVIKLSGWAIIESLSIGVGDSVSSFDISLKGAGDIDINRPTVNPVAEVSITNATVGTDGEKTLELSVGDSITLDYTVTGVTETRAPSNPNVVWKIEKVEGKTPTEIVVNERGHIYAMAKTTAAITVKCIAEDTIGLEAKNQIGDEVTVTVK